MKQPYTIGRRLRHKPTKSGHQVYVRIRGLTKSPVEIPVRYYSGNSFMTISVKKEHWDNGFVTGGMYHIPIRDLNTLLQLVEQDVKDAIKALLSENIKITYDNVLKLTYAHKEKEIIDKERIKKGEIIVDEDGGAFWNEGHFLEFLEQNDDPKFIELKRKAGLIVKIYILDYWNEYISGYAPDSYDIVRPSIRKYIELTGDNCLVQDYDSKWLERYFTEIIENGFIKTKKGVESRHYYEVSVIEKFLKILRNFGKWLFEVKKVIDTEDYKRFKLRNPKSKKASLIKIKANPYKNNHALLRTEFDHLFSFRFDNEDDALIRDLFILQTWFGGLRKSDFFDLSQVNITIQGEEVQVEFEQRKTDTKVVNMANKNYVYPILNKYGNQLPEFPSPNKYNIRLKKVFEKAGLDRKLPFRSEKANEQKARTEYFPMYKKVCNKWARNCAVSLLVQLGYNDHHIKKFTGHTDEKMLRHYRDVHKPEVKEMLYEVKPSQTYGGE